jgi:uncharacterized membrane protein (DUF2068 family)
MDWSLLGCGAKGHFTYAPNETELHEALSVATEDGVAWRCLRCGAFAPGDPSAAGPVSQAPHVRRAKELRSALILRIFAVERFLRAILFGLVAIALWRFSASHASVEEMFRRDFPALREFLHQLGFNVNHSKLLGLIQHAFTLNSRTLAWLAIAAGAYAVIEVAEGIGLWLLKRWGEYFAMVATSAGLPYEIYDLTAKITVLRILAFVVNLALVVYLVATKRLFGVRGGKTAYEARLRSESILEAEIARAAHRAEARDPAASPTKPSRPSPAASPTKPSRPSPAASPTEPSPPSPAAQPAPASSTSPAREPAPQQPHPGD